VGPIRRAGFKKSVGSTEVVVFKKFTEVLSRRGLELANIFKSDRGGVWSMLSAVLTYFAKLGIGISKYEGHGAEGCNIKKLRDPSMELC